MKTPRKSRRIQDAKPSRRTRKKTHGGARRSSGRKPAVAKEPRPGIPEALRPAPVPGIDWLEVWRSAWDSATVEEILKAQPTLATALADPVVKAAFQQLVAVGNGRGLLHLKSLIARRSARTQRGDGSSYVLALRARNEADYDRQLPAQEVEPDLGSAHERLRGLLVKLAENQSEIRGRTVSPLELIAEEAGLIEAKKKRDDE